jgi:hypothetical protein
LLVVTTGRVGQAAVWDSPCDSVVVSADRDPLDAPTVESLRPLDWQDWESASRLAGPRKASSVASLSSAWFRCWLQRVWTRTFTLLAVICGLMIAYAGRVTAADELLASSPLSEEISSVDARQVDPFVIRANAFDDALDTFTDQREIARDTLHTLRRNPDGQLSWKLRIRVDEPHHYPRIPFLDCDDEESLFYTYRPNLAGRDVPVEWDFYNLIATDRPDFTDATFTVGRGVSYLETGFTFRRTVADELHVTRRQLPEALFRFGLTDELELRVRWNGYIMTDIDDRGTRLDRSDYGGDDLQLGFKYEVIQQDAWRPMVTFVGGLTVPSGTRNFSADQVQPFGNVVFGWGLRRWLYLKSMTGVDFVHTNDATRVIMGSEQEGPVAIDASDHISAWHESVALLFQLNKHVGGYIEWFSFFSDNAADNRAAHYYDLGSYFYITPNVQFDIRFGQRISSRVDTIFTGAGFSTRW